MNSKFKILFEDNQVLVAVKPPGLLSQGDSTDRRDILNELKDYLKKKYSKPGNVYLGLVHRLDREVGGVMVFAKNSKSAGRLSAQVRERQFNKTYLAIVEGELKDNSGKIESYLRKNEELNRAEVYDHEVSDSKIAKLSYKVLNSDEQNSLLKIDLETGRFHQIRAQLASIGHPIVGDVKYVEKHSTFRITNEVNIALWAYKLGFFHPKTKEWMEFESNPDSKIHPWSKFKL